MCVYVQGSRRVYELEVRNQAAALERQLRRGAFRDSLVRPQVCGLIFNLVSEQSPMF